MNIDRDEAIKRIKSALRTRSGKDWSVKGGTGTRWGHITIDAPPRRRTWHFTVSQSGEREDASRPGHMSPDDRAELARLLGLDHVHFQGVGISSAYRQEYVDRAEGKTPAVPGSPC